MRGPVPGLPTPHPLGETLPGVYRDDDFVQRLCSGLDDVLAPVLLVLDSLPAYFDPDTAPVDVLDWLAGWVGVTPDPRQEQALRRAAVRAAFDLHAVRGTAAGVRRAVELVFDGTVEVRESGATAWSADPAAALPGSPRTALHVRLHVADPAVVDAAQLDAVVRAVTPAHVLHRVDVVRAG